MVFKQELNKWIGVSSSSLQYEQGEEFTFLNLKNILCSYKHCLKNYTVTF